MVQVVLILPCFYLSFPYLHLGLTFDPAQVVVFEEGGTDDETFREMVDVAVQRLYDALNPVF